jgi:serine/threonine-protein kinase HipA
MRALDVLLGAVRVGLLEELDNFEFRFAFADAWLDDPMRPTLGQFFEDRRPLEIQSYGHVPLWFDHLLPPEGGPLRRKLAEALGDSTGDPQGFDLLSYLGEDLPGAVIVRPGRARVARPDVREHASAPTQSAAGRLRFSLAGQQWKLSLREHDKRLVLGLSGADGTFWIAKFHSVDFADLPRIETATMTWAAHAGLEVPPCRLAHLDEVEDLPEGIPVGDGTMFLIERFDRGPEGTRTHVEDFAQVLDRPTGDPMYDVPSEYIAAVLARLCPQDVRRFCDRLVFNVLAGNGDAHLKNWSLIYPDGRRARLAPAYDLVSTLLYERPSSPERLALTIGGRARFEDVDEKAFGGLAAVAALPFNEVRAWVREASERVRGAWAERGADLPFTASERRRLDEHLAKVRLPA